MTTLGWSLVHFLWQGAVLGLAAFALLRLVRPRQAEIRYLIGVATLALMCAAPVATFVAISQSSAGASDAAVAGGRLTSEPGSPVLVTGLPIDLTPVSAPSRRLPALDAAAAPAWMPIVSMVWLAGVAVLSIRVLGGWTLAQTMAHRAVTSVSADIEDMARELSARLGLTRAVRLRESAAVAGPTLVGWLRPVVLLPAAALSGLSPDQLRAVLAHELAHVRRHDYLVNVLQTAIETLLFYHPAVWWVSAEVRSEREHCCDDLAVAACGDRLVYVSALAELTAIERRPMALAATDGSLLARVRRLLGRPADTARELPPSWGVLAMVLVLLGGATRFELTPAAADLTQMADAARGATAIAAPAEAASEVPAVEQAPPAPQEPPAPPAPPDPPAPPAPEASASGNFTWSDGVRRLSATWTGRFTLADDERDIASLSEGATLTIVDGLLFKDRVELRGLANGEIERRYFRNGRPHAYDPDGRAFLAAMLERMIDAGMFARERVARLLARGGVDAVFAAVDRLQNDSSFAKRVYYGALVEQGRLSAGDLARTLARVAAITSAFEKATLLRQIVRAPGAGDAHFFAAIDAARSVGSDFEQRRVLTAALEAAGGASPKTRAVLEAATMTSDFERARLLLTAIERGQVTPEVAEAFFASVNAIESNHEHTRTLTALLRSGRHDDAMLGALLQSARRIESGFERANVLQAVLATQTMTPATRQLWLDAAESISSAHERESLLAALVRAERRSR